MSKIQVWIELVLQRVEEVESNDLEEVLNIVISKIWKSRRIIRGWTIKNGMEI